MWASGWSAVRGECAADRSWRLSEVRPGVLVRYAERRDAGFFAAAFFRPFG